MYSEEINNPALRARRFAINHHRAIGQMYGDKPYEAHLDHVAMTTSKLALGALADRYITQEEYTLAIAGAWVHDLIEDCRVTYNDVAKELGEEVAELSYVLATPKGRNRAERHCDAYYEEIAQSRLATLIKLADRISNVEASVYNTTAKSGSMLERYRTEQAHFAKLLRPAWPELEPNWKYLDGLLGIEQPDFTAKDKG
jgi:(p)ppGpp synthase/HD superfamily hydrolase